MSQSASGAAALEGRSSWRDYSRVTTLSDMLAKGRIAKGMRQKDVAARLAGDAEGQAISNYERATNVPSADRMLELIELLEIEPGEAWRAWGHAQLTGEEAATSPAAGEDYMAPMLERRQVPRKVADPPDETGSAAR